MACTSRKEPKIPSRANHLYECALRHIGYIGRLLFRTVVRVHPSPLDGSRVGDGGDCMFYWVLSQLFAPKKGNREKALNVFEG